MLLPPDLREWLPLERLTGLAGAVERGSGLVAPALAALMIGLVGPLGAVGLTAVCFAVCVALGWAGLPGPAVADTSIAAAVLSAATMRSAATIRRAGPTRRTCAGCESVGRSSPETGCC